MLRRIGAGVLLAWLSLPVLAQKIDVGYDKSTDFSQMAFFTRMPVTAFSIPGSRSRP